MKGNNFQGVIMQGVGLLFIGISTIFFSVLIGFFKTLTSSSGTLAPWVGLPQVVPVTPLIIWVVMILPVSWPSVPARNQCSKNPVNMPISC